MIEDNSLVRNCILIIDSEAQFLFWLHYTLILKKVVVHEILIWWNDTLEMDFLLSCLFW